MTSHHTQKSNARNLVRDGETIFQAIQNTLLRNLAADGKAHAIRLIGQMEYLDYDKSTKLLTIKTPPKKSNPSPALLKNLAEIVSLSELPVSQFKFVPPKSIPSGTGEPSKKITFTTYSSIDPKHIEWNWKDYLAKGKHHHLAGNSTEGKSPVVTDLVACITNPTARSKWPDGTPNTCKSQAVVMLSGEDDPHDTVRPRLQLAKANCDLVFNVTCTVDVNGSPTERLIALDRDIQELLARARKIENLGAFIVDPISDYLGKIAMNKEEQVRSILAPLRNAAKDLNCSLLTIGHFNRREKGTDSLQRIMGAAAFGGVARFIYLFGPDPDDADKHSHVMVQKRGVGAASLRYKTVMHSCKWEGKSSPVIKVHWMGKSEATAESIVDPQSPEHKTRVKEAADILRTFLEDEGPTHSKKCIEHLDQKGFDVADLNQSRIMKAAGVMSSKLDGDKFYSWSLLEKND